ncbi:unnamed protein product [Diamesa serratosioi]
MQKIVEFDVELPVQSTSIKAIKLSSEQFYDINVGEKLTNIQLGFFGNYQHNFVRQIKGIAEKSSDGGNNPELMIDCDPEIFRHILNYCRFEKLLLPSNFKDFNLLKHESERFGIHGEF